ncbi:MAG: FkbM family methyltransferase [Oscillospiraceae bacterium]|nr:FkbM family methyltransferase [Oscillospiraceae bacterium]
MDNKELVLSWLEDEESRFIYNKRIEFLSTKPNCKPINEIVDKYCPEFVKGKHFSEKMNEFLSRVNGKSVYVWGAGIRYSRVAKMAEDGAFSIVGVIDVNADDLNSSGKLDITVCKPEDVNLREVDCLVVSMINDQWIEQVCRYAKENGMDDEDIIILNDYYDWHDYHLVNKQYFDEKVIFDEGEVFVDAGVLDLATSLLFAQKCKERNISKFSMIAFEPDKECYINCKAIAAQHPELDIELVNSGLYSSNTTIGFNSLDNGRSTISEDDDSSTFIDVVTLDSYINDRRVTYIKMDIEGAELEALKGCAETIRKQKPKLAISIYHKPEDLTEIPVFIKSLVPEYKFYIRHYSDSISETVLYALL